METVLVKGWAKDDSHKDGVVINKVDFVEGVHELFGSPEKTADDFLKRNAVDVIADIKALTDDELLSYFDQEKEGKGRTGVVNAMQDEIDLRAKEL